MSTGHFTQLVWKGAQTQSAGLSVAVVPGNKPIYKVYVVADYFPPGNVNAPGYFAANVLPPTGPNNCPK